MRYSRLWLWCRCGWRAWRLFCYAYLLCSHDTHAYDSCKWKGCCLLRGKDKLTLVSWTTIWPDTDRRRVVIISDQSQSLHSQSRRLLWGTHLTDFIQPSLQNSQRLLWDVSWWSSHNSGVACTRKRHRRKDSGQIGYMVGRKGKSLSDCIGVNKSI